MKVNNFGKVNMNPYQKQAEKLEDVKKTKARDKVQISAEAIELQKGNSLEKERIEKTEELKRKIEAGEYQVNPREVAKKIYEFWNN
ncbi:flagellar biosynthesis anti-sigma factor FlgM [Cytobacillus firmus]|uniref:flagellar biosynthesis anti-sigma factor FlgM n=1 Tax=Cytobacillus firmus TaxID=1399 RepID=UPI00077C34E5|nr:flagellar biosynthesis anti-sigma factor FlgM [Cytobacillus firmus]MBG9544717.1 flagellar biosynthesis anti-sigma factor FlgM [Cytobacillus firmus]MBG9554004.1 flagellar biosynthesis anti-sigma factor FlgM [Cytobacillus firmus]MBG9558464.1 flagellar biosynthesis anti-sigma factor FlgM [Cytobacillus firmus]MBG9576993.1 flagellar biosynthesis anti-sigma factor FlgM [Cytobacillus firmus]MEC1894356.1 flagellar biosynthesis anti-sigma factor FlgM [Cytobacillus firmus]